MSLAWIPRGTLSIIQKLSCRFLWKGSYEGILFAWVGWELISLPNKWGGWAIKSTSHLSSTLVAKSGWQILTSRSVCIVVVLQKYICPHGILDWIKLPYWSRSSISIICKVFLNYISYICDGLTYQIKLDSSFIVFVYSWTGSGNAYKLPQELICWVPIILVITPLLL